MRSERKTEGEIWWWSSLYSLFLSPYIPIFAGSVHFHQDRRFCLRHMWQEEPQRSWDTDGQIGRWRMSQEAPWVWGPGAAEVVPFSGPPPSGTQPTRVLLACSWPRLPTAPKAPSRPCFSPFPVAFADLLQSTLKAGHEVVGNEASGIHEAQSEGLGPKFREGTSIRESEGKTGEALQICGHQMMQVEVEEGWGPAMLQETGWSPRDAARGRMIPRAPLGALLLASQHISSFLRVLGRIPGLRPWGQASKGERLGHWGLSRWCADRQSCGSVILASSERFWRNC